MTDETSSTNQPARPADGTRPPRRPAGARRPASGRAPGGTRFAAAPQPSFLERYRRILLGGLVVVALVVVGGLIAFNAAQPAYACGQEWVPDATPAAASPAASPAPGATPGRLGYTQPDLGRGHIDVGQKVTYPLCPPASGKHYNQTNQGPVKPGFYAMDDETPVPQGFVHNLEHGGIVVLYKCPGDACTDAGQAKLKTLLAQMPLSPICGFGPTQIGAGTTIARFDQMAYPYAAMLWGQVLPLQTLDVDLIKQFFLNQAERTNPEPACARPTASPAPTRQPTASPAAPAASGSAAPASSGSPAASSAPSAAPSAATSPKPS